MDEVDFHSGAKMREILSGLLDHYRLLHHNSVGLGNAHSLESNTKELCTKLIHTSIDTTAHLLETGSTAEKVNVVRRNVPGVNKSLFFAGELDLMVVIAIDDVLAGHQYEVGRSECNPAFLTLTVDGAVASDQWCYEARNGRMYVSPIHFKSGIVQQLTANKDIVTKGKGPTEMDTSYHIREIEDHGAAIKIKVYKERPVIKGQRVYENSIDGITTREALVDIVPAIRLPQWPSSAQEWITRDRHWPPQSLVQQITTLGGLIVCKAGIGGDPNTDWRLSFSQAEIILISNRDMPARQHALRILKFMVKYLISPPSVLNSYHCKTVYLWACERLPMCVWTWDNLHICVLGLLDDLISAVAAKQLPHYFIREVNIFEHIPSDFLQKAGENLVKLRRDPVSDDNSEIGFLSETDILMDLGIGEPTNQKKRHYQKFDGDLDGYTDDKFEIRMVYLNAEYKYTEEEIRQLRILYMNDNRTHINSFMSRDLIPKAAMFPNRHLSSDEEHSYSSFDDSN